MASFTKGKWVVDNDAWGVYSNSADCYIALMGAFHINEEKEANARLIAEAPVMYDLLNKAFHVLGKNAANDAICREIDECLSRVDGAPVQKENGE